MSTLQEIEIMVSSTLKNEMELLQMRCYILRRVVGMTPMQSTVTRNGQQSYSH